MRLHLRHRFLLAFLCLTGGVFGVMPTGSADDLYEIYQPDEVVNYAHQLYVEPNWIGSAGNFWYVRESAQGRVYVLVEPGKETLTPLFDHARLATALSAVSEAEIAPTQLQLENLSLAEDFKSLDFDFQDQGYRFVLKSGELEAQDPAPAPVSGLSPDGDLRAFLKDHNLFVETIETGALRQLSEDGTEQSPYAKALTNPRTILEDNDQPDAADIAWSWDGRYIATYQMDLTGVTHLSMPDGERQIDYVYPKSMDSMVPMARLVVFDLKTGDVHQPEIDPIPVLYYGSPRFRWVDESTLMITAVDRGYKQRTVYSFDVSSQSLKTVINETSETFVNIYEGTNWVIYDWDRLLWISDIDGHTHIYLADLDGGEKVGQLTEGDWRVVAPVDIVESEDEIYFLASGRREGVNPYYRALYRIKRFGSTPQLLTPDEFDHFVYMSPDGAYIVDNISEVDRPTRSVLRRSRDGKILMELGGADISALEAVGYQPPEPFQVTTSAGYDLYGVLYRPADFDPSLTYPVIEQVYTGPHTFNTARSFTHGLTRSHAQAMANAGFMVIQIDAEGTEGRSRAFLEPAYKNLADVGLDTRVEAITALADVYPQLDLERVGAFGFSAGGYDVVRMLTGKPDFYTAGVAASGNYDSRWDKAVWNGQWLGTDDMDVYDENSMLTRASRLQGRLMLAHGIQDENVPVQATRELVEALNAAGKQDLYEVHYYPEGSHFLEDDPDFLAQRLAFFKAALGEPRVLP